MADIEQACQSINAELPASGMDRETLDAVLRRLLTLAADEDLWREDLYPPPEAPELQARYRILEIPGRLVLYLNVMRPGKRIVPHNHTTWACVAAVQGVEHNAVYERVSGGLEPGPAVLRQEKVVEVGPGKGIALMADDIHSVSIPEGGIIRHLHLYGKPLESLDRRLAFDMQANTCAYMDVGVKTRQAAGA